MGYFSTKQMSVSVSRNVVLVMLNNLNMQSQQKLGILKVISEKSA